LGLTPEKVHLVQSDSKYCPNSGPSGSSRSTFINSNATHMTAQRLLDAMKKPDGTWRTYEEMTAEGIPTKYQVQYSNTDLPNIVVTNPNTGVGDHIPIYDYMLFLAEVAVDVNTGKTTVLRFTCIDDVGKVTNIDSLNGQAYSGIAHGIGFALSEDYNDTMKHPNLVTCGFPYIKDIPDDITVIHCENFRKENALGSSGAAEGYQSSSHVAVLNAIADACGVRIYELPAKPEKVKAGLEKLARGEEIEPPAKFFLGSDVFEELDYILANPV
jgi:aldehyde oxidoreductase